MKPLIIFQSLPNEKLTALHVVNWGEWVGDKIKYITNDGIQIENPEQIQNSNVKVCKFEDINIKDSLFWWFKQNPNNYGKDLEIDYNIDKGEVYRGNLWRISLMINTEGKTIKIKPLFD